MNFDPHPTVDWRNPNAYADYARKLDSWQSDWWAEDLDRLAPKLAATPGPWTAHDDGLVWPERMGDPVSGSTELADAEFIAAARTAVPALLAALEEARRERDEAHRNLEKAAETASRAIGALLDIRRRCQPLLDRLGAHGGTVGVDPLAEASVAVNVICSSLGDALPVLIAVAGWMTGGTEAEIYAQKEALADAWDSYENKESTE